MNHNERVEQSRFGVKTRFVFEDDRLVHMIRDSSGERVFNVNYDAVVTGNTSKLIINNRGFAGRLILVSLAATLLGVGIELYNNLAGGYIVLFSLMSTIVIIVCNLFNVFAVRFILVPLVPMPPEAQGHPLRIIEDSRSASIMDQLEKRRKLRLKTLYGKADLTRDPATEMARIIWLRDNAVLSTEEFELEVARIEHGLGEDSGAIGHTHLN